MLAFLVIQKEGDPSTNSGVGCGGRQLRMAVYIVTIVRIRHHEPTRAYVERRTADGLTKREIIRCLKRHIAREVFTNLPRPEPDSSPLAA
ncbi:MAG: transposase [Mycobacterium sp.]|jgi:hypothetical protein|nr:transposase [Mycobacterium sp.]